MNNAQLHFTKLPNAQKTLIEALLPGPNFNTWEQVFKSLVEETLKLSTEETTRAKERGSRWWSSRSHNNRRPLLPGSRETPPPSKVLRYLFLRLSPSTHLSSRRLSNILPLSPPSILWTPTYHTLRNPLLLHHNKAQMADLNNRSIQSVPTNLHSNHNHLHLGG